MRRGSSSSKSMLELKRVKRKRAKMRNTDSVDRNSIIKCGMPPLTCCAYSAEANANEVTGNEYAHHATLNLLIDFLNSAGLHTCLNLILLQLHILYGQNRKN